MVVGSMQSRTNGRVSQGPQKITAVTTQWPLQAFSSDQKLDVTGRRGAKRCSGRLTELLEFRSLRLRLRSVFLGVWVIERKAGRCYFK
jgi:hypothetical protein